MLRAVAPVAAERVLAQGICAAHTGTTSLTTIASATIPAGTLGPNSSLLMDGLFSYTNSANAKTLRFYVGSTLVASIAPTTTAAAQMAAIVRGQNSLSSQALYPSPVAPYGSGTTAVTTATIDIATDQTWTVQVQLASAGESITCMGYTLILRP